MVLGGIDQSHLHCSHNWRGQIGLEEANYETNDQFRLAC